MLHNIVWEQTWRIFHATTSCGSSLWSEQENSETKGEVIQIIARNRMLPKSIMQKGACNHVERTKILKLHNIREGERCGLSLREPSQLWHLTIETREIDSGFRWNRMTGDLCRDKHTWHRYGKMRVGTKMTQSLDASRNWCSGFAPVHMRLKHGKTSSKRIFLIMYQQFSTDARRS